MDAEGVGGLVRAVADEDVAGSKTLVQRLDGSVWVVPSHHWCAAHVGEMIQTPQLRLVEEPNRIRTPKRYLVGQGSNR